MGKLVKNVFVSVIEGDVVNRTTRAVFSFPHSLDKFIVSNALSGC